MTGAVIMVSPLSPSAFLFRFLFVFFYLRSSFCLATVFALLVVGSGEGADQGHSYRRATNENKCSVHFQCAHEWYGRLHSIPITLLVHTVYLIYIVWFRKYTNSVDSFASNHAIRILFTRVTSRNRVPLVATPSNLLRPRLRHQCPCAMVSMGLSRLRFRRPRTNAGGR